MKNFSVTREQESLRPVKRNCIMELAPEERPQERMIASGPEALSDAELIGLIIRSGSRTSSAVDLGRKVLDVYQGDLRLFYKARIPELCRNRSLAGIGEAKACQIMAALELGKRIFEEEQEGKVKTLNRNSDLW